MTNLKNKTAFSLIELSIVILIIGIIIAGITQSSRLVRQFKLSTARNQTQSGPVASIKDLGAWFETTLPNSFIEAEVEDSAAAGGTSIGTGQISTWYDVNPASSNKHTATNPGSGINPPNYYANCMNGLPCLRFDATNTTSLSFDGTFLAGADYTIFVVEQRRAATALYFLGKSSALTANAALEFGYAGTSTVRFSHGDVSNHYTVGTSPAIASYTAPTPRLHTFVNATIAGISPAFAHYLNGDATASTLTSVGTPAMSTLTAFSNAAIGSSTTGASPSYFTGDIGEMIFYSRALKTEERTSVEDYLLKKWGITSL